MFPWVIRIPSNTSLTIVTPTAVSSRTYFWYLCLINLTGSPWGAGTLAGGDGSRKPTESELEVATIQGEAFYNIVKKVTF